MDVTVAVCTWNRSSLLSATLEQMTRLRVPADASLEVLVVDNNSTDDTQQVIASFVSRLPIRSVVETRQGLSSARNRAVAEARGEYLIWTDDDVLVDAGWLEAYHAAFVSHPEAAIFGGPVEPWFDGSPPRWLEESLSQVATAYALREFGSAPFPLDEKRTPFGANFAIRGVEQRQVEYDPSLGRNQSAVTMLGEEVAVIRELLRRGATGWWVPEARVQHWIPQSRQNLEYIRQYYTAVGRTGALRLTSPTMRFRTVSQWVHWIGSELAFLVTRRYSESGVWLRHLVRASRLRGRVTAPRIS